MTVNFAGSVPFGTSALQAKVDYTPSPFPCSGTSHNRFEEFYLDMKRSWWLCDSPPAMYCYYCFENRSFSGGDPNSTGTFYVQKPLVEYLRGKRNALICTLCKNHQGFNRQWMRCDAHEFNVCNICIKRDSMIINRHRLDQHSGQSVAWIVFTEPKADGDSILGRDKLFNTSRPGTMAAVPAGSSSVGGYSSVLPPAGRPWGLFGSAENTLCDFREQHRGGPTFGPVNSYWYNCVKCQPRWAASREPI